MRQIATILTLLALAILAVPVSASTVAAQDHEPAPTLVSSAPAANAVLPDSPDTITLSFSQPVEPETIIVHVLDISGTVNQPVGLNQPDPASVSLPLASPLHHGSWLVSWRIEQPGSNGPASGFFGFTVGTDQDVAPVTIPDTGFSNDDTPRWMSISAYGLLLTGLSLLIAIWPFWSLAARPARHETTSLFTLIRRLRMVAATGALSTISGALLVIAIGAWNTGYGTFLDRLFTSISDAGSARLLLLTIALVSLHSLVLSLMSWSIPIRSRWASVIPWMTTFALTIPGAWLSHATDEPAGQVVAVTVTWLALTALSLWIGGIVTMVALLGTPGLHRAPGRHLGSTLAITASTVVLTGAYAGWLFIGNRIALTSTTYGAVFMALCILVGLLLIASIAMILIRRNGPTPVMIPAIAAIIGIMVMVAVGGLMATDTARSTLIRETAQEAIPFDIDGDPAQLILAPGAAGVNHFRLELDRPSIPLQTTAALTMSLPSHPELGSTTVPLSRVNGDAFEHHGTELVVTDRWKLAVTLTEPGHDPVTSTFPLSLDATAESANLPDVPWRFATFGGVSGWLLLIISIAGIVVGIASGKTPVRKESAGMGAIAMVLAVILLGQARLDPILAIGGDNGAINPDNLAMITRGEEIYRANCLSCHGAGLRGDGPASAGMQPPPADFSAPHTMVHDEATLIYWLRHGKQGTAMPPFGDVLSDQDIRDVLSYIARQQQEFVDNHGISATPAPQAGS